ncbi:MAG: type II toxin-antitoxin system HicA family toxin [Candidatus Binatia bacterium]|jgi:predicted RNA binding protein YcfA (HicA-like mRNA interferase family)
MSRLPSCTAAEVVRVLKLAGFALDHTSGSHYYFRRPDRPRPVPVPFHRGDIKRGLLNEIIRQAGLTTDEFVKLLRG